MIKEKIPVAGVLNILARIRRERLQQGIAPASVPSEDTAFTDPFLPGDEESMELFELQTLLDALESFPGEPVTFEAIRDAALAEVLDHYYAAEESVRERGPGHELLIPFVEEVRAMYRQDFGTEIPEKE
jgi:hypothetical protein